MQRIHALVPFLLSALLLGPRLHAQVPAGKQLQKASESTVTEPKTGIAFPTWIASLGTGTKHELTGVGARTKTIFGIKVYAVGFYIDARRAAKLLVEYKDRKDRRIEKDKRFAQALLQDDFGKSLRLVMARNVDAEDMREAFEDILEPRIKSRARDKEDRKGMQALQTFRSYFKEDPKKGDELIFTWEPGGRLYTRITGKDMPVIESPTLCWALFDAYLGNDPVIEKARVAFLRGVPPLLQKYVGEGKARKEPGVQVEPQGGEPDQAGAGGRGGGGR